MNARGEARPRQWAIMYHVGSRLAGEHSRSDMSSVTLFCTGR